MSITNVTIARIDEVIDNKDYLPFIGQIEPLSRIPDWIKPLCRNCKNGNILPWYKDSPKTDDGTIVCSSASATGIKTIGLPQHVFYPMMMFDNISTESQWISDSNDLETPQYVGYVFDNRYLTLKSVHLVARIGNTGKPGLTAPSPKLFRIEGTKDGQTWEEISEVYEIESWSFLTPIVIDFKECPPKYRGFRVYVYSWNPGDTETEEVLNTGLLRVKFTFEEDSENWFTIPNFTLLNKSLCLCTKLKEENLQSCQKEVNDVTKEYLDETYLRQDLFKTFGRQFFEKVDEKIKQELENHPSTQTIIESKPTIVDPTSYSSYIVREAFKKYDIPKPGKYSIFGPADIVLEFDSENKFKDGDIVVIKNMKSDDQPIRIHANNTNMDKRFMVFLNKKERKLAKTITIARFMDEVEFMFLEDEKTFVCEVP